MNDKNIINLAKKDLEVYVYRVMPLNCLKQLELIQSYFAFLAPPISWPRPTSRSPTDNYALGSRIRLLALREILATAAATDLPRLHGRLLPVWIPQFRDLGI